MVLGGVVAMVMRDRSEGVANGSVECPFRPRYRDHMASTGVQLIDADTFLARGENDAARLEELIGGQIMVSQPTARHQIVRLRIGAALASWCSTASGRGLTSMPGLAIPSGSY